MNIRTGIAAWAVLSLVLVAGCGPARHAPASTLTEHQRDSVLARSAIPGASAVGHAFDAAATEAGHAAQVDSLGH